MIGDNSTVVYFDNYIDTYFESPEWKKICRERIGKQDGSILCGDNKEIVIYDDYIE